MELDYKLIKAVKEQKYPMVFVTISGAHLYGFPSPDSDYDLRGVHVLPAKEVVGLDIGTETIEVSEDRDGVQLDLVTHDIKKFFGVSGARYPRRQRPRRTASYERWSNSVAT